MFSNNDIQQSFEESRDDLGQKQVQENQIQHDNFNTHINQNITSNNVTQNIELNNLHLVSITSQSKIEKVGLRDNNNNLHQNISEQQSYYQKAFQDQAQSFEQQHNNYIQKNLNYIPQSNSKIIHQHVLQISENLSPILKKESSDNNQHLSQITKMQNIPIVTQEYVSVRNNMVTNLNSFAVPTQQLNHQQFLNNSNNGFLRHSLPAQHQQQKMHLNQHIRKVQQPVSYPFLQNANIPVIYAQNTQVHNQNQQHLGMKSSEAIKINSGHFIPLQLERSEIVYKTIPHYTIADKIPQFVQPTIIHKHKSQQRAHSSSRTSANIVFNYKVHDNIISPITQVVQYKRQSISPPVQHIRSEFLSKVVVIPERQVSKQKIISPVKILKTSTEVPDNWKQRYFNLFSHVQNLYLQINTVNSQFINIHNTMSMQTSQEKLKAQLEKFNKFNEEIKRLQIYSNTVYKDWKMKGKSSNENTHLQTKYKRLLFNFSKLQQENNFMKANFSKKITGVVKKLQSQNKQLMIKIEQITKEFNKKMQAMSKKELTISPAHNVSPVKVQKVKKKKQEFFSDYHQKLMKLNQQLYLSVNERNQFQEKLLQEQKRSSSLKKQIEQLTQNTIKLSSNLRQKDKQIRNIQQYKPIQDHNFNQYHQKQILQLQSQNQSYLTQNKQLKDQIQRLCEKNNDLYRQIKILQSNSVANVKVQANNGASIIQSQFQFTVSMLRTEIKRKDDQIERESRLYQQRITDLTEQLKISYQERENIHKKYDEKINNLQKQRQKKQTLIFELKQQTFRVEQNKKQIQFSDNRKNQYSSRVTSFNDNQEIAKYRHEVQILTTQKQRQKKQYQQQINSLEQQTSQFKQDNMRLKKQISDFANNNNEVQGLNEILSKKNMEILQLKNLVFDREKLLIENNNLRRQIQRLQHERENISIQYEKLNKNSYEMNRNIKELEQNFHLVNGKFVHLEEQYRVLAEANDRKDHQILKLRQNGQLLEVNIQELERQLQKSKGKTRSIQLSFEDERARLSTQISHLTQKINDYEKVIREISILQQRINELQSLTQKYDYQLRENDQLITKQKNIIKTNQSQIEDFQTQIQTLVNKLKQNESKVNQNSKKYKKLIDDLQQKNKSLQQKQIKFEKNKISELETDLKTKDNKIWKLQKNIQELEERLDQVGDQQLYGQKIIVLQQKVKDYQARLFNQTFKYNSTNYDYQATKVFEKKVIYELKEQNQKLKQLISKKKLIKPTTDKSKQKQSQKQIQQAYDEELDEVHNRLQAFNSRLQKLINPEDIIKNIQTERKNTDRIMTISQVASNEYQLYSGDNVKVQFELRALKIKHSELQKYCKNIEVTLLSSNTQKSISTTSFNAKALQNQQNNYHKQKNRELEERVDVLLKMNKQLKENIDDLLKKGSSNSSNLVFKQNATQLSEKNKNLQIKIKKILSENQSLQQKLSTNIKTVEELEGKLYDSQRKIIQFQRNKNERNLQKGSFERQVQTMKEYLLAKDQQINDLKIKIALSNQKQSSIVLSLREKIESYDIEFIKLQNKSKMTDGEIQRLNEALQRKQAEYSEQANRWRLKATQLQQEINKSLSDGENQKKGLNSMKLEISRLVQQLKNSNFNNQELKESNDLLLKKIQQSQIKYRDCNENELINIKRNEEQYQMKLQYYQGENSRLITKIRFLQSQIERITEDFTAKIRNYEHELATLQGKIGLTEMQHMKLKNKSASISSEKQTYENDLIKQKNQISLLSLQVERLAQQLQRRQKIFEQKIIQLKSQYSALQTKSDIWMNERQKYQQQIIKLTNQIAISRQQIQRLNDQIRQIQNLTFQTTEAQYTIIKLKRQNQQLRLNIESSRQSFSSTITKLQQKIRSMAYFIEIQRSIFLEIQALMDEKAFSNQAQSIYIIENIGQEIQKGLRILTECYTIIGIVN